MIANWYFIHSSIFSRKALKFDIMEENATHNIFSKTANLCSTLNELSIASFLRIYNLTAYMNVGCALFLQANLNFIANINSYTGSCVTFSLKYKHK